MTDAHPSVACPPGRERPATPRRSPPGLGAPDEPETLTPSMEPLVGGAAVGVERHEAGSGRFGTVGLFARDGLGRAVGLTAGHLVARAGVDVYHPRPPGDGPCRARGRVVQLRRDLDLALVVFDDACVRCDAVWAGATERVVLRWASWPELDALVAAEARVVKCGRSTGVTEGRLVSRRGDRVVVAGDAGAVLSAGGDSGALWCTPGGVAVGLHLRGGVDDRGPWAHASPMPELADALRAAPAFV